jgi:hypothetical protein
LPEADPIASGETGQHAKLKDSLARGLGRWRAYATELEPLISGLPAAGGL